MKVGIDIGTSYSSIAVINEDGVAEPIRVSNGACAFGDSYSMPSAVYVEDNGSLVIGQIAVSSKMRNPSRFKGEFKRNLGQKEPYIIGPLQLMPEDLYKEIFVHLKESAEKAKGERISKAFITYPANYSTKKKGLIEVAAKKAGLLEVELLDEPTAAAYCYCSKGKIKLGYKLLVYDFGGGTFDASLIQYTKQGFQQMTESLGVENCGGIDIDRMIFEDIYSHIPSETLDSIKHNEIFLKRFNSQIMETSVKIKHQLTTTENYKDIISIGFESIDYEINREKLNKMIAPLVEETLIPVKSIVKNANLKMNEIDIVLIVGGTSRIPYIEEKLRQVTGKDINNDIDPELAICKGAAMWGNNTVLGDTLNNNVIKDNKSTSIGIRAVKDEVKSLSGFQKNVVQEDAIEQLNLGLCYKNGNGVKKDLNEAIKWLSRASDKGNAQAQYQLGICYLEGQGVAKDIRNATAYFEKAARNGCKEATIILKTGQQTIVQVNKDNYNGIRTVKYEGELIREVRKTAEWGNATAQLNLGLCYKNGSGVNKDINEAVKWFSRASDKGNAQAQYQLGICYLEGQGVSKDIRNARAYFEKAVGNGCKEAENKLRELNMP